MIRAEVQDRLAEHRYPANFTIRPSGRGRYVANRQGDATVQYVVNAETGELKLTGHVTPSITAVAIGFGPARWQRGDNSR